jgi:hypothetical protein
MPTDRANVVNCRVETIDLRQVRRDQLGDGDLAAPDEPR